MGFLTFSRPNKRARVASATTNTDRPSSLFAPVLSDWLDSSLYKTSSTSPPRQLEPLSPKNKTTTRRLSRSFSQLSQITVRRRASTVTVTDPPIEVLADPPAERTLPGTHPIGTPRTKMTGRRPMSNYTVTSLPPGAAAPAFGSVLDYDMNDAEYFSRPSIHLGPDDRVRCMSMSLDSYSATPVVTAANNNKRPFSIMSRQSADGAPVVPPRSHLRGFPSSSTAPSSTYSKVSSSSSSPMASGRTSPERPFVLAVEPPSGNFGSLTDEPEVEEIINFRPGPQRTTSVDHHPSRNSRPLSGNRDPLKVRDQRPARKSSSGVYTPPSFPGPHGSRPSPSQTFPSPSSLSSPQPGSPGSPEFGQHSPQQGLRARTFSGLKRISAAVSPTSVQPTPQLPNRTSQYPRPAGVIYAPMAALPYAAPPLPVRTSSSMPQTPRTSTQTPRTSSSHWSHGSLGSRDSYSPPSSSQSVKSVSPPATPTTPSLLSDRGKVVIAGDSSEDELQSPLGLDLEPTPKPSPRSESQSLALSSIPVAEHNVPLSPTAPKRARRKPVPRLEDDLATRLEAIEV